MKNVRYVFKIIVTSIIFFLFILIPTDVKFCKETDTLNEQQEEFKIQDFINSANEYPGEV